MRSTRRRSPRTRSSRAAGAGTCGVLLEHEQDAVADAEARDRRGSGACGPSGTAGDRHPGRGEAGPLGAELRVGERPRRSAPRAPASPGACTRVPAGRAGSAPLSISAMTQPCAAIGGRGSIADERGEPAQVGPVLGGRQVRLARGQLAVGGHALGDVAPRGSTSSERGAGRPRCPSRPSCAPSTACCSTRRSGRRRTRGTRRRAGAACVSPGRRGEPSTEPPARRSRAGLRCRRAAHRAALHDDVEPAALGVRGVVVEHGDLVGGDRDHVVHRSPAGR